MGHYLSKYHPASKLAAIGIHFMMRTLGNKSYIHGRWWCLWWWWDKMYCFSFYSEWSHWLPPHWWSWSTHIGSPMMNCLPSVNWDQRECRRPKLKCCWKNMRPKSGRTMMPSLWLKNQAREEDPLGEDLDQEEEDKHCYNFSWENF